MDGLVFQHVWQSQLQHQFEERVSALFLENGHSSQILAARSHTATLSEVSPVTTWSESEKTQTSEQQLDRQQSADGHVEVISNTGGLEIFKSNGEAIDFYLVGLAGHTWSSLAVTRELFDGLCYDLTSSAVLMNLINQMGSRSADESSPPIPSLCTNIGSLMHHEIELCYALRYIARNNRPNSPNPWSMRQFVVHSKVAGDDTEASWICIALPEDWFHAAVKMSRLPKSGSTDRTLQVHHLLLQQSFACWRPYLSYLEKEVANCDRLISFATPSGKTRNDLPDILLRLRNLENQIDETGCSLQSNGRVVHALQRLAEKRHGLFADLSGDLRDVRHEADFAKQQIQMVLSQLEYLRRRLNSCSQLASSFLVQNIATISAEEATKSRQDAATVKALTTVASVFLPTTLVLNFFSTSFVESKPSGIIIADEWWLFLAVGVPLTCLVFAVWAAYVFLRARALKREAANAAHAC